MFSELLGTGALGESEALRQRFESAQPFRHVAIDNFLDERLCRDLIAEFPSFEAGNARNESGEAGGKAVHENVRLLGDAYRQFDDLIRCSEFLKWLGDVTGIGDLRYDPDYVGGGTHENRSGQELDPHVDFNFHPITRLHRRLNLIVFLSEVWDPEWGGVLEFHRDPWDPHRDEVRAVAPARNRCVIFETTERSWHGFRRIEPPADMPTATRKSLAVYFYTSERPADETAPEHSTIYVPRPLPKQIEPGRTLDESDVTEIEVLLTRRDGQIRFLYHREQELLDYIARINRSPSVRLAHFIATPARWVRDWIRGR